MQIVNIRVAPLRKSCLKGLDDDMWIVFMWAAQQGSKSAQARGVRKGHQPPLGAALCFQRGEASLGVKNFATLGEADLASLTPECL